MGNHGDRKFRPPRIGQRFTAQMADSFTVFLTGVIRSPRIQVLGAQPPSMPLGDCGYNPIITLKPVELYISPY